MIVYRGCQIRYAIPKEEDQQHGDVKLRASLGTVIKVIRSLHKQRGRGPLKRGIHCKACDRPIEQDLELCYRCLGEADSVFPKQKAE